MREREREREREGEGQTDRKRQRDRDRQRDRQRQRETKREKDRETHRETDRETERQRERQREAYLYQKEIICTHLGPYAPQGSRKLRKRSRRWKPVLPTLIRTFQVRYSRSIGEVNSNRVTSSLLRKCTRLPTHAYEVRALTFEVTDNFGSNDLLPCGAYGPWSLWTPLYQQTTTCLHSLSYSRVHAVRRWIERRRSVNNPKTFVIISCTQHKKHRRKTQLLINSFLANVKAG